MSLHIPNIDSDDPLAAALAYAAAGWYVAPIAAGTKNPGSVLGSGWQHRTMRDPKDIAANWAGTNHGVALHAGRSGAVILDVDHPDQLPEVILETIGTLAPPMQSTRRDEPDRGHYLFLQPPGRDIGNSNGQLGKAWGEVRGRNGVIVVAPSVHPDGGLYTWQSTGALPYLPASIASLIPDGSTTAEVATDSQITAFMSAAVRADRPRLLLAITSGLESSIAAGNSRHNSTVEALCWAMREAKAGLFTAADAAVAIRTIFTRAKPEAASGEWIGMLAWAVSHALASDAGAVRAATEQRTNDVDAFVRTLPSNTEPSLDDSADRPPFPDEQPPPDPAATEPDQPAHLDPLPFLTLAQLRAKVAAAGPRRWLLRGYWPAGDYGVHAAEQKAQKTWNTADLAVSVASGTPWLGLIEVEQPGPVLMFVGEGGEGNTARRLSAICESRDIDPDTLQIHICTRAPHLNDVVHLSLMRDKLEQIRPALVTLDPLYLAARGAELGDLYKMGALLEAPQIMCQAVGASLFVVTHFNRQQGSGSKRITGAGPAEWGRVLITSTVKSRRTDPDTKATDVVSQLEVIGGEIPDQALRINRRIWSDDPDNLDSPLHITTAVDHIEDTDTGNANLPATDLPPAARKLLEALTALDRPATNNELVDWIVQRHGHGLKRETVSRTLNKLLTQGLVDSITSSQRFEPTLWLLARDPRDITRDDHTEPSRVTSVTAPIGGHTSRGHTSHDDPEIPMSHDSDQELTA